MIATVICAAACALLVLAEWRGLGTLRVAAKLTASAAFVYLGATLAGDACFARWVCAGLLLGAIGDLALLGHGQRWFVLGVCAFLAGHVAYIAGIAQLEPPGRWLGDAGFYAVMPAAAAAAALAVMWPRLGALKIAVIAYVVVITVMVIAAIAAARAGVLPAPQRLWLATGATLFFVSDLAVARDRFIVRAFANKLYGLPAYYAAQLLIAWSITSS